jgi:phospholipid/cholesterol/gamma-HCH transport system substrate-binding protein
MPAAKKRTELYVGLFLFTGTLLLGGLVLQFGKFRERWAGHYTLTVVFDDASGVIKGSEVRMGGARIGQVASIPELNEAVKVEVPLTIRKSIRIPVGSTFQINSATLLGDKLIVVIPAADRSAGFILPDSRLEGAGLSGLDAIQSNAETVSRDVIRIIKRAETTLEKIDNAVNGLESASGQLDQAMAKINGALLSEKNLTHVDGTLENLHATSVQWNAVSSNLAPALDEVQEAIQEIRKVAARADATLKSADDAITRVAPALEKIPKAVDQFTETTEAAGQALERINRGEGLLGALAADNEVAFDAKVFMRNLKNHGILRYKNPSPAPEKRDKSPSLFSLPKRSR